MNTDTVELVETAHNKDTLRPKWNSLIINSDDILVEIPNFVEPQIIKVAIPANTQKQILDRYAGFMRMSCKVRN